MKFLFIIGCIFCFIMGGIFGFFIGKDTVPPRILISTINEVDGVRHIPAGTWTIIATEGSWIPENVRVKGAGIEKTTLIPPASP